MTSLLRGVRVNAAIGLMLLVACCTGTVSTLRAQTPAKALPSPPVESKGGQQERIKVHGHWTIDVRNPDGSLVTHREFENDLQSGGAIVLAQLLARNLSVGEWSIVLDDNRFVTRPCFAQTGSVSQFSDCQLNEANGHTASNPAQAQFKTLAVSGGPNINTNQLILSGSATALLGYTGTEHGSLNKVTTRIVPCASGVAPQDCKSDTPSAATAYFFTSTVLSSPVTLEIGQIIQVTVVISFS